MPVDTPSPLPSVFVVETGAGKFQAQVDAPGGRFLADEPRDVGGLGSGPGPFDLLSAALGACTSMTCRLYADQKGWPLKRVAVQVQHVAKTATAKDRFTRQISFEGELDPAQRQRLLEIAERCPVHRTLTAGSDVVTLLLDADAAAAFDDHFAQMQQTCAEG